MSTYFEIDKAIHGRAGAWLIEIDDEGFIVRELEFDGTGTVRTVTKPGDYGFWNDSMIERLEPGSPDFTLLWSNLGAVAIDKLAFEARWADATRATAQGGR